MAASQLGGPLPLNAKVSRNSSSSFFLHSVGEPVGTGVGGALVGVGVGKLVVGDDEGDCDGNIVGVDVGTRVGLADGLSVGDDVGIKVGGCTCRTPSHRFGHVPYQSHNSQCLQTLASWSQKLRSGQCFCFEHGKPAVGAAVGEFDGRVVGGTVGDPVGD